VTQRFSGDERWGVTHHDSISLCILNSANLETRPLHHKANHESIDEVTMGCFASKDNYASSKVLAREDDVDAVIPYTVTTFGAKYLVPHGKCVYLSFDKMALLQDKKDNGESASFVIADVTNGQEEHETARFLVERENSKEEEQDTTFKVLDPATQQVIFFAKSSGEVYDAKHCLLFGLPDTSKMGPMTTSENLINLQGKAIQLLIIDGPYDHDDDDFSYTKRIDAIYYSISSLYDSWIGLYPDPNKKHYQKPFLKTLAARMIRSDTAEHHQLSLGYFKRHYVMQVAPGVDMALIVALVLAAPRRRRQDHHTTQQVLAAPRRRRQDHHTTQQQQQQQQQLGGLKMDPNAVGSSSKVDDSLLFYNVLRTTGACTDYHTTTTAGCSSTDHCNSYCDSF
jgi:hypothetical protein